MTSAAKPLEYDVRRAFREWCAATVSREEYERVCAQRDKLRILALELATKQGYTWEEAERLMYPQPEKPASAARIAELEAALHSMRELASVAHNGDPWYAENEGIDAGAIFGQARQALGEAGRNA